jgi:P27 family predicted phage terminase small subunit
MPRKNRFERMFPDPEPAKPAMELVQPLMERADPDGYISAPSWLSGERKRVFERVVRESPPDWFEPCDAVLLGSYVDAILLMEALHKAMVKTGPMLRGKIVPEYRSLRVVERAFLSMADALCLTPAARHKMAEREARAAAASAKSRPRGH